MSQSTIFFRFMPYDNKPWRVCWFGDVRYHNFSIRRSMPSIAVILSERVGHTESIKTDSSHQIFVPVGFLGKLRVGDVWQNGQLLDTPQHNTECFTEVTINRNTTSIIKAGLSSQVEGQTIFFLPLAQHPHHASHTQSYCLKVELPDNKRLIIPAIELIRFYFGSSSGLLTRLFQFPLTPDKLWVDAVRGTGRKKSRIVLADGISGWSASDVARIAFDPVAWHVALLVGNSLAAAKINGQQLYPKAHFPFNGKTTLQASGVWLPFGNDPAGTFLVYRLASCSRHFPFSGLEYQMTGLKTIQSGGVTAGKTKRNLDDSDANAQEKFINSKATSKKYVEEDPSKDLATSVVKIDEAPQFPDLRFKSVRRFGEVKVLGTGTSLLSGKLINSSSVGTGGDDGTIRPVDLVRQSHAESHEIGASQLMVDLVESLSVSRRFDKIELMHVNSEDEEQILSVFKETLRRYNGGAWGRTLGKRLPEYSNLKIAVMVSKNTMTFLLMSEINNKSRLSPLCIAVRPDSSKTMLWPAKENIVNALALPDFLDNQAINKDEVLPHFIAVPYQSIRRDYFRLVKKLSSQVTLYCEIFH